MSAGGHTHSRHCASTSRRRDTSVSCSLVSVFSQWGYGLHSVRLSSSSIFLASWAKSIACSSVTLGYESPTGLLADVAIVGRRLQAAEQDLTSLGVALPASFAELINEAEAIRVKSWKAGYARVMNNLKSGCDNERSIVLQESSGAGSGAWLQFPCAPNHHFSNVEFSIISRIRMHYPIFIVADHARCGHMSQQAACGIALDSHGLHALCCKRGGKVVQRHNHVRDILADSLSRVGTEGIQVEQVAPDFRHPRLMIRAGGPT